MNEEEKKTFKFLKNVYGLNFKSCSLENVDIKNIVNIIEKQQKEIKTLKESQLVLYGDNGNIVGCIRLGNDVISKDKIKEKIKYYHKQREKAETKKINDMYVNYIDCLEELLSETNE